MTGGPAHSEITLAQNPALLIYVLKINRILIRILYLRAAFLFRLLDFPAVQSSGHVCDWPVFHPCYGPHWVPHGSGSQRTNHK